jgi:hypothetical protein
MEITNCPDCGNEIINTGLAFWPGCDEPVAILACQGEDCGWVGVEFEAVFEHGAMERGLVERSPVGAASVA